MRVARIFSSIIVCVACLIKPHDAQSQIISTIVGTGTAGFSGDNGPALNAEIDYPWGIKFDTIGNLYIADYFNYRVRKVNTSGIISTVAGNGTGGNTGDGGPAVTAEIGAYGITFNPAGNLCISAGNYIRLVNAVGTISSIVGSPGSLISSGDGGSATAAHIGYVEAVAYDSAGNLYIADVYNTNNNVRKVNTSGIISTLLSGISSEGLTVGAGGYLYVSKNGSIRKVNTTSGAWTTFVGTGVPGYSGDGGQAINAQVDFPVDMVFDAAGNLFFSDRGVCNCVRKVDAAGIITTIAGNGTQGFSGDGGLATSAQLNVPYGIALDALGNLYISDAGNNRIRMVTNVALGVNQVGDNNTGINIYPNPASDKIHLYNLPQDAELKITLSNVSGQEVAIQKLNTSVLDVSNLSDGMYFLKIETKTGNTQIKKVIIRR